MNGCRLEPSYDTFIPAFSKASTVNYFCTWRAQNDLAGTTNKIDAFGLSGHAKSALVLTEENFLGRNGLLNKIYPNIRKDLYVVYDVGWDVPLDVNKDMDNWKSWLGSLIVAEDKFPSCTGTPVEKLFKLDSMTKALGWKGAGLWVHAQQALHFYNSERVSNREYFIERLKWVNEAGIKYWKVDYGAHCADLDFREMLSELAEIYAPELIIEHARNGAPLNDYYAPYDKAQTFQTGRFCDWDSGKILDISLKTDVFRTYDVSYSLNIPTTLDRVAGLLSNTKNSKEYAAILNCESEPVIGAGLGCA